MLGPGDATKGSDAWLACRLGEEGIELLLGLLLDLAEPAASISSIILGTSTAGSTRRAQPFPVLVDDDLDGGDLVLDRVMSKAKPMALVATRSL